MKKRKKSRTKREQIFNMTEAMITEVKIWLARMEDHAARAITLAEGMSRSDLDGTDHRFWALAKYAENVQESVVQLDNINPRVYPALAEVGKETWSGFKGMRSRLAHAYWKIDPDILWSTVTVDLIELHTILSRISVLGQPAPYGVDIVGQFRVEQLLALPNTPPGSFPDPGASYITLIFRPDGKVSTIRLARDGDRVLVIADEPLANLTMQRAPDDQRPQTPSRSDSCR